MSEPSQLSLRFPRILVVGGDQELRDFCRDGLPWAGCATEYARDVTDAITGGFSPDVMLADLPAGSHSAALLQHLREYAEEVGSMLIALTDDLSLVDAPPIPGVQVLFRPCPPETLWDALAIAMAERDASQS